MLRICACIFVLILFSLSVFSSNIEIPFRYKRFPEYESPKFGNLKGASLTLIENGYKEDIDSNSTENQSNITPQRSLWFSRGYRNLPDDAEVDEDAVVVTEKQFDINKSSTTGNEVILDTDKNEDEILNDSSFTQEQMNESILLHRNNCNLEIQINEWEDRKLNIQYEDLQNGISGQCETTLYCKNDKLLAILVSNIHFSKIDGDAEVNVPNEVLRVISSKNSFNFTLKEYDGNEKYYPVILTDTNKIFLVFSFGGKASFTNKITFDLEVFNYYNRETRPILQDDFDIYGESQRDIENIFITTVIP